MVSIVSYNVNGIRAALRKGLVDWLEEHKPTILCVQETKATPEQVDIAPLEALGYTGVWESAEKKGYSGVAIFSKIPLTNVQIGCGNEAFDAEGRFISADINEHTKLINVYFPSGTSGDERQAIKMKFLAFIREWIKPIMEKQSVILVGDYNIAHTEIDIHNPKSNKKTSGFLPEERMWLSEWFDLGFVDAFRFKNPEEQSYSWWSYRAGARKNDKGWRIDYQSVSEKLAPEIEMVRHCKEAVHSDHCPLWMDINI